MKINCSELRDNIKEQLKEEIKGLSKLDLFTFACDFPDNAPSKIYVANKEKLANEIGIRTTSFWYTDNSKEGYEIFKNDIIDCMENGIKIEDEKGNVIETVKPTGIIVQLPLHPEWKKYEQEILDLIPPTLDVDGFGKNALVPPCTPKGIMKIFDYINYDLTGKDVILIGRGKTVGEPLRDMLINADATVTICHSKTDVLTMFDRPADVIIGAANGILNDAIILRPLNVVIDAGVFRNETGKVRGCFSEDIKNAKYPDGDMVDHYTSSPGGVGLLTVACLMENLVELKKIQEKNNEETK